MLLIFIVTSAIFAVLSLIFGEKFVAFLLKSIVSTVLGGLVWFIYGITTGQSSLEIFLGVSAIVFVFMSIINRGS